MHILETALTVSDLPSAATFFRQTLDCPVDVADHEVVARIGTSLLRLHEDRPTTGTHHMAFNVAPDRFDAGKAWLAGRAEVMTRNDVDEFALPDPWRSRSVYFTGPDGMLLELIAREALPRANTEAPFTGSDLRCISEIGIPVPSVSDATTWIGQEFGLTPFAAPSQQFHAVGDDDGLLILASPDRIWFPTADARPSTDPVTVTIAGHAGRRVTLGDSRVVQGATLVPS